jgi:hypothetical protein
MIKHKDLFIESYDIHKHFNLFTYFCKGPAYWKSQLNDQDDFIINKVRSNKSKCLFIQEFLTGLDIDNKTDLNIKHGFDVADASNMYTKYKSIFRDRSAVLDLTKAKNCQKVLVKIYIFIRIINSLMLMVVSQNI